MYICIYVQLIHLAVQLKLTHYKSTILQQFFKIINTGAVRRILET